VPPFAAPPSGANGAGPGSEPPGRVRTSRRTLLQAGLIGGAGVAALPFLALVSDVTPVDVDAAADAAGYQFNTGWLFGGKYTPGSENVGFDDKNFSPVTLPHTVTELSWRNWDPHAWESIWIYRRHFEGAQLLGNRVFVDFDGVMVNAAVVLNGETVGTHQGGYLPWSVELTDQLQSGENVLAVIVDSRCLAVPPEANPGAPQRIDFLQPGGIYRDVTLRVVSQIFLSDVFALPGSVLTDSRYVDVQCTIDAAAPPPEPVTLTVQLLDGERQVAAKTQKVQIATAGTTVSSIRLTGLGPVTLWSPSDPKLYTVQATCSVPGTGMHTLSRQIGFREASFRPEGFFLNGERVKIFGLDRHQLYPYTGMAMPARVQRRDAEILKNEFNCNMVRCSHYPQSPHFLDACDQLGLMVWEEAPGWHNVGGAPWQDIVVQNVRDMVVRDRSRPSVVIWGTRLNETGPHPVLYARTRQAARELDGSRPTSGAMSRYSTDGWDEDVFAFNDYHVSPEGNASLKPPARGIPYLVTESVGVVEAVPRYFRWTSPPALLAKQAVLHAQVHNIAASDPRYAGLLGWVAFDYASMIGRSGDHVKWAGVADGFRVPKPGAAVYQSQLDPRVRPVIVPVFAWDFTAGTPPQGPGPNAMIATNCEQIEIFVDGAHTATGTPVLDAELYGRLSYPPALVDLTLAPNGTQPELRINGYIGGQLVATVQMSSDTSGDYLGMTADDAAILADGSDMTRVTFRALDKYGNQRRTSGGEVILDVAGPGLVIGDNPFPFGEYGGLGAVWIRSVPDRLGTIRVTARHPTLGRAEVRIEASASVTPRLA
jgi:beta-galactosidase